MFNGVEGSWEVSLESRAPLHIGMLFTEHLSLFFRIDSLIFNEPYFSQSPKP
ncbi:unnamed protein product [Penicillium roqueforti FM164]|uniref:Genomic scaffold, ProqFM164S01 n=1 Tax=Penicillium roqueforti (strain FM164) TaxID=1365484 RepID=W6PW56_PENRF|nr:unnamed protein product [Penicillium roqueforti FM164]